jgi:putative ABC transport system ATP-binding protein
MTIPIIETVCLSKQYRIGAQTIDALSDLTVSIHPGEFVAIMGPSGSGKSTCMHLLGCLQSPSAGQYRFDGEDVLALDPDTLAETRNARMGFLFQSFNLLPRATALCNVELPLVYGRTRRRFRRAKAEEALRAVGLEDRMQHRPDQLSGGQMQRVAIARALVNKPRLLLADEPTGALDSHTGSGIMELFARLNAEGITIVLVTHDEDVALCARRILRFRDGKMIADEVHE